MTTRAAQAQGKEMNKSLFYFALCLIIFGTMTGVMMVPALLTEIAGDLEVSVAVAGQLATATFAAWAVSIVAVGPLADFIGRRALALVGVFLVVVSLIASAFAPNFEVLMALRVLAGLGGGALPPTSIGVISDIISQARRAQAIGGIASTIVLTSAISIPLMALFADLWGWRFTFVLAGVFLAAAWILNWIVYPRDSRERARGFVFFSRYWSLLSLNYFRVAPAVNVTQRMAYWSLLSFFAAYLIQAYDVSVGFVALPLVIFALSQVIGSYMAGILATKSYRVALVAVTSVVGGVCGFLFFVVDIGLWPAGGGYGGIGPVECYNPRAVGRQHGILWRIQGNGRQSYRIQQPDGRCLRGRALWNPVGKRGLRWNRLSLSSVHRRQCIGGDRVRPAAPRGHWLRPSGPRTMATRCGRCTFSATRRMPGSASTTGSPTKRRNG